MSRLERLGHQVLDPAGVTFETDLMTYRGGGSESGRTRRMASAIERLARDRGAIHWPATAVPASHSKENHP